MSVLHSNTTPPIGQAAWEAAHTVEAGTVTAAMLADAYQPLDSDLTAIAALTTTAYGRAFLALADAAAARTALALGTAATQATGAFDASGAAAAAQSASQPLDSDLTAIAALATTSFGRGLLTSADAAALRTSAALGTLATQSGTFSGTSSGTNTGDQTLSDATISTTDITTNNVSTSKHGFTPKLSNVATQYLDGTGAYSVPAGSGALAAHPMPLDAYAIDATYGDDFTAGSLNTTLWTRRGYVSGSEAYQVGPKGTYLRLVQTSRVDGDGYFQTVPSGDWTFAMAFVPRFFSSTPIGWGIAAINSVGTGVATTFYGSTPNGLLLTLVTTYTTYGGSFVGPGITGTPGAATFNIPVIYWPNEHKVWVSLRKASGNYYAAYSLDGELWSPESAAMASAVTLDRVGMFNNPLGDPKNANTDITSYIDVDWFNKIA